MLSYALVRMPVRLYAITAERLADRRAPVAKVGLAGVRRDERKTYSRG
ncbi:MAG: hypothetical protein ACLPSF_07570 [Methylocella sp.]